MRKVLLLAALLISGAALWAQKPNIAPSATVTCTGTQSLYPPSTLNDLNLGVCGTQQFWMTSSSGSTTDYIEWDWGTLTQSFDEITFHQADNVPSRQLVGGVLQAWDGSNWVAMASFSNLPLACENTISFQRITTTKLRMTQMVIGAPGATQFTNVNFREIEIFQASVAPDDAGITMVDSAQAACPGSYPVSATVQNFGINQIDSVQLNWEVDGILQTPVWYTSPLDTIGGMNPSSAVVTLGSYTFAANTNYNLRVWTSMPNGTADTTNYNDTLGAVVRLAAPSGFMASNVQTTSADLSWNSLGASNFRVTYGAAGFNPQTGGSTVTATGNSRTLSSLTANTLYEAYLVADCGSGVYSDTAGPISFRTPCTVATAPFSENFDGSSWVPRTGIDPCWSTNPSAGTTWSWEPRSAAPTSGNGPLQDLTGGNFMYCEASISGTYPDAEFTTPPIDVSGLNTPGLYFFQHRYSGATIADMTIEVSNDFGTNWNTVYTITGDLQSSNSDPWELEFVNLAAYTGDTVMVKFLQKFNGCCGDAAIDSVVVDEAPTCPWPTGPTVVSTTDTSVVVTWNDPTGSNWEIIWGPPGFTQASPGTGTKSTSYNPDTITGLQSNTDYEFYVRTDCDTNGNSIWIGPISFTTNCSPLFAPYSRNFDSDVSGLPANCWAAYKAGPAASSANAYVLATTLAYSAPNALYIYNFTGAATSDTVMAVSPSFGDLTVGDKQVRFKAYSASAGNSLYIGTMSSSLMGSSLNIIDTISLTTGYLEYISTITTANGYNGTDTYIALVHSQSVFASTIYVDDFTYEVIPPCPPPASTTLGAASVGSNSATLVWGSGVSDSTMVEVGATGYNPGTGSAVFVGGTQDTFIVATGLSPQTTYDFYIQDTCNGIGTSGWVGPFTFTTACLPVTAPYTETFDGTSWVLGNGSGSQIGTADPCWTRNPDANATWAWSVYNSSPGSGLTGPATDYTGTGNFLYTDASYSNQANPADILSPLIDVSSLTVPYVQFYYHRYGDVGEMGDMEVAVNDGSGWVTVTTLTGVEQTSGTDPWEDKGVDVSAFGDTIQVRFRALALICCQGDMAIDQFEVKEAPSCPDPVGLAVSGITDSSASLTWLQGSGNPNYQVWFGPQGFYQGTQTVGGIQFINSTDSVYLDTLTDNTCYEYLVRAVCAPGDTSEWVGPVSFCTPCLAFNAPYQETYDIWPPSCWDLTGGPWSWNTFAGPGGDNYAEANFWGQSSGFAVMTSPVINMGVDKAVVEFDWSHLYSATYPFDQLLVAVNKVGTSTWDTIVDLQGPTNFNDPTAGNSNTPGNFITHTEPLDSATYANASIRVRMIAVTDFGPDLFVNNFKVRYPVSDDLELIGARFKKDSKCLSNSDTAIFQVQNVLGSTVNFANDPLTVHYEVTGPVNTTSSATVNSGTLPLGDTIEVMATNIDLSQPGNYTLNAWIAASSVNLDPLTDSLLSPVNITIFDDWDVQPDTVVIINNMIDTVVLEAKSPFLSGGTFFITEVMHFKTATGAPSGGWPSWHTADEHIEITGVPGSSLAGITFEQWNVGGTAPTGSYTFPAGAVLGPNGTAIVAMRAVTPSPSNYFYDGSGGNTVDWQSAGAQGVLLKDGSGNIIDAVGYASYTWPAQAGVTASDWTGSTGSPGGTCGIRLNGPDLNNATGWSVSSATNTQDPNTVNSGVALPAASATAGFDWKLNGVTIDTLPKTVVGPYSSSGVYNYIATFNGPCGLQSDTVTVIVNLPGSVPIPTNLSGSAPACDSIVVSWNNAMDSAVVAYVVSGGTQGAGNLVVNDSSYAAVGVMPNTSYDFYVANIMNGDTSAYAGPYTINSGTAGAPGAVINYTNNGPGGLMYGFDARGGTGDRATYEWIIGTDTLTGDTVGYTFPAGGAYTVTLVVTNACGSDTATLSLPDVSMVENALSRSLKLYPNPAKDVLNVELNLEGKDDVTVRIIDVSGKEVIAATHAKDDKKMEASIDLSELAKGVYMIEVSDGKYTAVRRLVKE